MSTSTEDMKKLINLLEAAVAPAVNPPAVEGNLIFELKVQADDRVAILDAIRSVEHIVAGLKRVETDKNKGGFIKDTEGRTIGTWGMRSAGSMPNENI